MDVLSEIKAIGCLLDGHFVYKSGRHGATYVDIDPIFTKPDLVKRLSVKLAEPYGRKFDVVAAPATGGVAWATALSQNLPHAPAALWADKDSQGRLKIERLGFVPALRGRRVLVVDDLLTTSSSVAAVIREVARCGGNVVGLSVIWNRGGLASVPGAPRLTALCSRTLLDFAALECPLCHAHKPIVDNIGHGARWKMQHPRYPGGFTSWRLG